ncbi:hypothetical protein Nepgr_027950 [Nepenthes gracilis]|uniref:Uncharacterized protein n=1 Tax=Nepenthes gracilis TaxID=150966 RepID=A0AAD3TB24_NEPGR|nr:hypothetical protein Nepgr_027950 [Nepenthes gracilis]
MFNSIVFRYHRCHSRHVSRSCCLDEEDGELGDQCYEAFTGKSFLWYSILSALIPQQHWPENFSPCCYSFKNALFYGDTGILSGYRTMLFFQPSSHFPREVVWVLSCFVFSNHIFRI